MVYNTFYSRKATTARVGLVFVQLNDDAFSSRDRCYDSLTYGREMRVGVMVVKMIFCPIRYIMGEMTLLH